MRKSVVKQNKDGTWSVTIHALMSAATCGYCKAPLDKDLVCTKCGCVHTVVIDLMPLAGGGGS